ncbi:MAG: DUF354 domain-containing protein [Nanoarchaeota archaeon]|nr:DUF354 domain-containing protein [Nanoarchaeota archaeon]
MLKVWIDVKNSHEPAFFLPFIKEFNNYEFCITSRQYAEVVGLLNKFGVQHSVIGRYYEGNRAKKAIGVILRDISLFLKMPSFDVNISHGSINSIHAAKMRMKKAICFSDNDAAPRVAKVFFGLVDYLITPNAIPMETLIDQGAKNVILQYNGLKEDIYIADFKPDPKFLDNLPFDDFIAIRPESLQADYIPKGIKSIVPKLIKDFNKENINILFLPRYKRDKEYARNLDVYIPKEPLNGLDICWYSKAVLTGAGTFAREAACMGAPAVSFFPGRQLLSVDQKMINDGWMIHSRDPKEIVEYVLNSKKRKVEFSRSKKVQKEVLNITKNILEEIKGDVH